MLIKAQGNCSKCGKPYSDFGFLSQQATSFYCERCNSEYELCPDCKSKINACPKCGARLLDEWEHCEKMFGGKIIF